MVFVNERISDEDRKKYGIDKKYTSWTVDHNREIFLLRDGVNKEACHSLMLYWEGSIVNIRTTERVVTNPDNTYHIYYENTSLYIPNDLKFRQEEIKKELQKFIQEYDVTGRGKPDSTTITVKFTK